MISYLLKIFTIYLICLFKFIAGPILGSAAGFNLLEIIIVSVSGMMSSVIFVTYLGKWFKNYLSVRVTVKKKIFSSKNRRTVKIWRKFGPIGVAALTPIFLTPIGGSIIMSAFNVDHRKILTSMFISAVIWALVFGVSIDWLLSIPFWDNLLR
jgi:membrane protein DedA with SNARE-associated domain